MIRQDTANFEKEGSMMSTQIRFLSDGILLPPSNKYVLTEDGLVSDGHHTFEELYRYRLLYNAALFNEWAKLGLFDVHKSRFHHDGSVPFDDSKWFIVVAELPTGQISNHYRVVDHWDLFNVEVRVRPNVYDGHTPAQAADRLEALLRMRSSVCQAEDQAVREAVNQHRQEMTDRGWSWES